MVDIFIEYPGGLRCSAVHSPSQTTIYTDAPKDNHGKGESFSPTDLLATALGTCMLTVMGILCNKRQWLIDDTTVLVHKEMTPPPRKIARLTTTITIPAERARLLNAAARAEIEHAAHTCPVRLSLHDAVAVPVTFNWQE